MSRTLYQLRTKYLVYDFDSLDEVREWLSDIRIVRIDRQDLESDISYEDVMQSTHVEETHDVVCACTYGPALGPDDDRCGDCGGLIER